MASRCYSAFQLHHPRASLEWKQLSQLRESVRLLTCFSARPPRCSLACLTQGPHSCLSWIPGDGLFSPEGRMVPRGSIPRRQNPGEEEGGFLNLSGGTCGSLGKADLFLRAPGTLAEGPVVVWGLPGWRGGHTERARLWSGGQPLVSIAGAVTREDGL